MAAFLIQTSPPAEFPLVETGTVIGRAPTAGLRLQDPSISREHARILLHGDVWQIMDLGSANGTLVNEIPVRGMGRLNHGDRLRLGDQYFVFHCTTTPEEMETAPSGATFISAPQSRQVLLLVADLRGFTPLSSRLSPSVLAAAVRYWCDECRRILESHGAILDKFIGDCAFAWWSGHGPETRKQAVQAAMDLLKIAPPPEALLECGVALHRGEAALCRMPDASFTLLGSEVNTTFRMESLTRITSFPILASQAFVEDWPTNPFTFQDAGTHPLKGLPGPVQVFGLKPGDGSPAV